MTPPLARIGTAGWSIPRDCADQLPGEGSHLHRYAAHLSAAEINSSFHRPHRRSTYERWAASVPPGFRFAVKMPRTITHDRRLVDCQDLLVRFADEVAGLGDRRGPTLVQLPPSLAAPDEGDVRAFFAEVTALLGPSIVLEPRHASWFGPDMDRLLAAAGVARVAADPARLPEAAEPGGWAGLAYYRLHGSPVIYRSSYDDAAIAAHARRVAVCRAAGAECWTIYDNTASGAAMANALELTSATVR